ncbi:MAG: redox-sensing transcriptional repressor Rex [Gemmatimonadetes bacterium]|nr:redox-sensing transcriptional repressor Rex [Gemmatimonadota bacterium]
MARLKRVVLDRLIRYYRFLADVSDGRRADTVTSSRIGAALEVDPSQVRKDFGTVGLIGMSRVGYDACEVCRTIRTVVGFDRPYGGVLIGAGKLGGAILASAEVDRYGLRIVAAFDSDPFKVGRHIEGVTILPIRVLATYVMEHQIRLAILTIPPSAAQPLADLLVSCGVEAIWNFTPARLEVPRGVLVRNQRLTAGLGEIAYHLKGPRRAVRHRDYAAAIEGADAS